MSDNLVLWARMFWDQPVEERGFWDEVEGREARRVRWRMRGVLALLVAIPLALAFALVLSP